MSFQSAYCNFVLFIGCCVWQTAAEDLNCKFSGAVTKTNAIAEGCKHVEGRIRVDSSSGLSHEELISVFKSVTSVHGVVTVTNTVFGEITFLAGITSITGDVLDSTLEVTDNANLTVLKLSSLKNVTGIVAIQNNVKLSLSKDCGKLHDLYFSERKIHGNLDNCGCELHGPVVWPDVLNLSENCTRLYGRFEMSGSHPPWKALRRFESLIELYGYLSIKNTNLETLGFLRKLRIIESRDLFKPVIEITMNSYLGRLDLISLSSITGKNGVVIDNNANVCADPSFVQLLISENIVEMMKFRSYCLPSKTVNRNDYCFGNASTIPNGCKKVVGDSLYFNASFDSPVVKVPKVVYERLQSVEFYFGSIVFINTDIQTCAMPQLKGIYAISDIPATALRLQDNAALTNVSLPLLENVGMTIMISCWASPNLSCSAELCHQLHGRIAASNKHYELDFDGGTCELFTNEQPIDNTNYYDPEEIANMTDSQTAY